LGEEILEFFMATTVKTHLSVLAQKIPALYPGAKGVGDREILETYFKSASKNTSETNIFPLGTKSLLTSIILITHLHTNQAALVKVHELTCNYYKIVNFISFLNQTFKSAATVSFRGNYVRL